ncbi:MAG: hypothetical protein HYT07_02405 [Candidatus Levybacteria bacterium]|nr:hypothetical protein [Candidatus Levybacteria bacterium]
MLKLIFATTQSTVGKIQKDHAINISILFFSVIVAWHKILSHTFLGEGYWYILNGLGEGKITRIFTHDLGAILLFNLIKPVFADNFFFYQLFALISFVLIGALFYFFVYELTGRKEIGLIAAVLFAVNFTTSLEMLGLGSYQNFAQRVFFLILLLPSFILFLKFKKNKNILYYFFSLLLSGLSSFFAQFSLFYLVFFGVLAFTTLISVRSKLKKAFVDSFLIFLVFAVGVFVIYFPVFLGLSSFIPKQSLFVYIFSNFDSVIFHSLRQLVIITVPEGILKIIFSTSGPLHKEGMQLLFIPSVLIYLFAGIFLYKKERALRIALLTSLFFLPLIFIFNMYLRGDNVDHLGPGSRYLFAPSMGFAIFWAISFSYIIGKKKRWLIYPLIAGWIVIQIISINRELEKENYKFVATKKIVSYIKEKISPKLHEDSIVIVPNMMGTWGARFCKLFYGMSNTLFLPLYDQIEWIGEYGRPFDPTKDIVLDYDFKNDEVVDVTKDYKKIIIDKND